MIVKLGTIAGGILAFLKDKREPVAIRDIHLSCGESKENICMAIGWLTREGVLHVECDINSGLYKISLVNEDKNVN